jgi:hypothetical protein
VQAVKAMREVSKDKATNADAARPTAFQKIRHSNTEFIAVPEVSSEKRLFIPMGFVDSQVIASNTLQTIPNSTLFHFGVLTSSMHNAWMRATCGRLESRYRYSAKIVYNNFPWPDLPEPPAAEDGIADATRPTPAQAAGQKKRAAIDAAAQAVLDARASFPPASLADLYDPLAMPPALTKAHHHLDKTVDAAYAYKGQADDASRVAFLFGLYEQLVYGILPTNA